MTGLPEPRFQLRKVAEYEWLILDHCYDVNDPRIYRVDEVEVMWMRQIPAATRYMSPNEVPEDVRRLKHRNRFTRPIPSPDQPPLLAS